MPVRKAAIPIGGLGTRLYPFTVDTSKPMVRFLNRFIIDHILTELAINEIDEVFLGVSGYYNYKDIYDHLGERFNIRVSGGRRVSLKLRYQPNIPTLGNAHSIAILADYYGISEDLLVVQGDTIVSLDLRAVEKTHEEADADMTVVLSEVKDKEYLRQLGVARLKPSGEIVEFVEKPADPEKAPSNLANTGVYLISEGVVKLLRSGELRKLVEEGRADFGRDVIPYLISKGYRIVGHRMSGYWFDVGTLESYVKATFYLLKTLPPERLGATTVYHDTIYMQGQSPRSRRDHVDLIERAAKGTITLGGYVLLGRHVSLRDGSSVEDSVIDNYVIVGPGARIQESIIMDRSLVGPGAEIRNSVIGRHVTIGSGVRIFNSYIGNDVQIGDNAVIENAIIWPHKIIEANSKVTGKVGPSPV